MARDDDWQDEDDERPRRRRDRDRFDDEDFDDDYDRIVRRGSGARSGAVSAVGVINIVLGSLVTLLSFCVLLGGIILSGQVRK